MIGTPSRRQAAVLCALLAIGVLALTGIRTESDDGVGVPAPEPRTNAAVVALGKRLFFDASLSASGRMACATCHSPAAAYAAPNDRAVQFGGRNSDEPGTRAVPTLRYTLNRTPIWFHEQSESLGENLIENEPPAGGFTADGRFDRLRDQAAFPFLASFHPYTSKYDAFLDGYAVLTPQETRGKKLFDDPLRGGCEICHLDERGANGAHPIFTDYQFEALGVPRNTEIPADRNPHFYDMGLCGPVRTDKSAVTSYCGLFKTPTLRNVATRHAFFHNGRFHTLRDALRFYVERDTNPGKWYPIARGGAIDTFDDLPPRYRSNVDVADAPFNRKRGGRPIWSESDISAVAAFLRTLTDGYSHHSHDGETFDRQRRRTRARR
jgi:cytochrome c peroxidase